MLTKAKGSEWTRCPAGASKWREGGAAAYEVCWVFKLYGCIICRLDLC